MKKRRKPARYLLLCAVLLLALWLLDGKPVFTAQSVLNRLERANLAEESRLLDTRFVIFASYNSSPQYEEYLAAGVTDTHLHLARLWKRNLLWYRPQGRTAGQLYAWPLEEVIVDEAPAAAAEPLFFCYTALPAVRYQARLTAGDVTLTASGPCAEGGFTLFDFGEATPVQTGYDALEVTLLDVDGNPLTTARRTFV